MLSVSHLEPTEVSFESVGVTDDVGIVEEVKHMGKRMNDQTASPFEIAEDTPTLRGEIDLFAILYLPVDKLIDPLVAGGGCADGTQSQKQTTQTKGVRTLGTLPTPHQSLALNVDQTALQSDLRPLCTQVVQQLRIPIGGDTDRSQSATGQLCAERSHSPRSLVDTVEAGDHTVGARVHHHGDRGVAATEVCTVDQQVPVLGQILQRWWFAIQPMMYDAPQCSRTQAALLPQLPYAVSFAHPSFKPNPLPCASVTHTVTDERALTGTALPALPTLATVSIPKHVTTAAERTCLFDSSSGPSGINAVSQTYTENYNEKTNTFWPLCPE